MEPWVVHQDALVEAPQRRGWQHPELVGEEAAMELVGAHRFDVATGPVERHHHDSCGALAERVRRDDALGQHQCDRR